jgi:hypothetical protein
MKCLSLAVLFFGNPTNKTKLELHIHGGLLIANHLDQSLWSTNQKYWAAVMCNLLHSFWEVHNSVVPFTSHVKLHEFVAQKPISWAKPVHFDVFPINFTGVTYWAPLEMLLHGWSPWVCWPSARGREFHQYTVLWANCFCPKGLTW